MQRRTLSWTSPLTLAALAPAALCSPVQSTPPVIRKIGENHFPSGTHFGRTLIGNLTSDLQLDVVFLANHLPVFSYSPAIHKAIVDLPLEVNDIEMFPGGAPDGLDAIVATSDRGLERWWPNGTPQQFGSCTLGSNGWIDATRVRTVDLDASGTVDVVGLCADHHTLRMLFNPLGTWNETTLVFTSTVYDFVALDWDFGAQPEIAVLTSTGVQVVRQSGLQLASFAVGQQGNPIAVMRGSSGHKDRLVGVFTDGPASHQSLYLMDKLGSQTPLSLGSIGAVGIAVGALNSDTELDLVISQKAQAYMLKLINTLDPNASFSLDPAYFQEVNTGFGAISAATNTAVAAINDIDYDSEADIVYPEELSGALQLFDYYPLNPVPGQFTFGDMSLFTYDADTEHGVYTMKLGHPTDPLSNANAVQYVVWRQETPETLLDPQAVSSGRVPLNVTYPQTIQFEVDGNIGNDDVYWLEARLVRIVGGQIVAAGPSSVAASACNSDTGEWVVQEHGGSFVGIELDAPGYETNTGPGIIPLAEIPDFEVDVVPNIPP